MFIEPSADVRLFTAQVRQIYMGFLEQEFTPEEALLLTNSAMVASVMNQKRDDG